MAKRYCPALTLLFLCVALCASPAQALWVRNGTVVCAENDYQFMTTAISDGENGAVLVWLDRRNGIDWDIYGNRIDSNGNVLGDPGGVAVCTAEGDQMDVALVPDGTGGAIGVWSDFRVGDGAYHLFAQRVDGTGIVRWEENGIPICLAENSQYEARIVPDGSGGAIIIWADYRLAQTDIYAQRVNADGDTLWAADGIPIEASDSDQWHVEAVPDGSGGAYIAWMDNRDGFGDIYAQRIDVDGNVLWGSGGIPIRVDIGNADGLKLAAATGGGACITWIDFRDGYNGVFAQKVDQNGLTVWESNGMAVCSTYWNIYAPQIVGDGSGGAIIAWYDERTYYEVYAQRVDASGNVVWPETGVLVFPSYGESDIRLMADGAGGVIAALDIYWDEDLPSDIYAQRLDPDGNPLWGPKGAAICNAFENQYGPALAPDGRGGVIIAWEDYRIIDNYSDIYCQRIGPSGLWGNPEPEILSCLDVPADQGGWVRLKSRASSHDVAGESETPIMGYNVWRMIGLGGGRAAVSPGAAKASALERTKLVDLLSNPATASGVRVEASEALMLGLPEGDWESVGFWFATRDTVYNIAVPTKDDSTEAGTPLEVFIVTAHASMAGMFVASAPDTGYSVDNLAPGLTAGFEGDEIESPHGLMLSWSANGAPDVWKYDVHRGDDELFAPDESNRIGTTDGTTLFDPTWVKAYEYFYKLVAVDRHGNASPAALLRPENINVGTMLQSFAASLSGSFVKISWTLSEAAPDVRFVVLRSAGGAFEELAAAQILQEGASYAFEDETCEPGTTYRYRVDVVEEAGRRTLFETEAVSTPAMPLTLHQNHPNPFNPSTTIGFYLPVDSPVTLDVYDSSGRLVARLLDGAKQMKGTHSVEWRGLDVSGRTVSSGVYFYRLRSGRETLSRKMILLR
jgi:hypothetical protein